MFHEASTRAVVVVVAALAARALHAATSKVVAAVEIHHREAVARSRLREVVAEELRLSLSKHRFVVLRRLSSQRLLY